MSQRHPADQTTTDVLVRTADHAEVTTIAHFRTGNRSRKVRASAHGRGSIPYGVRTALAGFGVRVSAIVPCPAGPGPSPTEAARSGAARSVLWFEAPLARAARPSGLD
jgi:hypothetical protein